MKTLFILFWTFLKIGAFMFGGGYAMLPIIQRELVENKNWATNDEILDYYAVAQCTPGVIAVNVATFVGCKLKGFIGGVVATIGVVFIPVIIISSIATALKSVTHIKAVQDALWGIRIAVCASITVSVWGLIKKSVKGKFGMIIFLLSFLLGIIFNVSPIYIVIGSGIAGVIANFKTIKKED